MKRWIAALLVGLGIIMGGCVPARDAASLRRLYSGELATLNYLVTSQAHEMAFAANTIGTLVEYDAYGILGPGLAESWQVSEDGLVWTFTLREGLFWVDHTGEPAAPLTAEDFVTAARYVLTADNASATANILYRVIDNAREYYEASLTDFDQVGVWAPDGRTVCYQLTEPAPYFPTMLTYGCFMPVFAGLLERVGESFGRDEASLYYSGAYYLAEFSPQQHHLYRANDAYWDKDQVFIRQVREIYNKDAAGLEAEMFRRGEVDLAAVPVALLDDWKQNADTAAWVLAGRPGNFTYFYAFNFNVNLPEEYEPDNWEKAVNNVNFRRCVFYGMNRVNMLAVTQPDSPQKAMIQTITPPDFVYAGDRDYTQFGALAAFSDEDFYNPELARVYAALAREELAAQGVSFPIKVLMPYFPGDAGWALEAQVAKQQLEELLGGDYIEVILEAGPATGFIGAVRRSGRYCLLKCNWGPDYADPETYTDPFLPGEGGFNFPELALGYTVGGVHRYTDLLERAKAQRQDLAARYEAFARAEAFLIDEAMVIPFARSSGGYWVGRVNPLEGAWSPLGLMRYKGMKLYDSPITGEEYARLLEAWQAERAARLEGESP